MVVTRAEFERLYGAAHPLPKHREVDVYTWLEGNAVRRHYALENRKAKREKVMKAKKGEEVKPGRSRQAEMFTL